MTPFLRKLLEPKNWLSAADHARSRYLWSRGDLQRHFHACRSMRRLLAKAGKLDRRRRLCLYADESDPLPLDSLGALPMYLAGIVFLIMTKFMGTKVYGRAAGCIWDRLISAGTACRCRRHHGFGAVLTQFREMHPMLRLLLCGAIAAAPCLLILMPTRPG